MKEYLPGVEIWKRLVEALAELGVYFADLERLPKTLTYCHYMVHHGYVPRIPR